jgi:hypothetical protein
MAKHVPDGPPVTILVDEQPDAHLPIYLVLIAQIR